MDTQAAAQADLDEVKSKDVSTISPSTTELLEDAAELCDTLAGSPTIPQPLRKRALAAGSNLSAIVAFAQKERRDRMRGDLYAKK